MIARERIKEKIANWKQLLPDLDDEFIQGEIEILTLALKGLAAENLISFLENYCMLNNPRDLEVAFDNFSALRKKLYEYIKEIENE